MQRWAAYFSLLLLLVPALGAVKRSSGTLGKGTPWETNYYVAKSDRPGPLVIISGGVHGDEPAGAAAAEQICGWPILCGSLAVLPRANPPALTAHTRNIPTVDKALGNLNRDFPKAGQSGDAAGEQAKAIWRWVQSLQPTWLVDLHEGTGIRGAGSTSVGSSVIVCPSADADEAAGLMLSAVNATIDNAQKRFVRLGPPVNGSLARAAGEHLGARAMILETSIYDLPPPVTKEQTQKAKSTSSTSKAREQRISTRVRQQRLMVHALLAHLGIIDPKLDINQLDVRATAPGKTCVALYDAEGTGGQGEFAVERILNGAGMQVVHVGPTELSAGTLGHFDLAVFPGGSGSKEGAALGEKGRQEVRQFVERGGGYVGICAGAYLCTSGYDWSLKILNAKTVSPRWQRGQATLKIELTTQGRKILGDREGLLNVHYHNGPVITRANLEALPDYQVLAYFRTEVANNNTPTGVMVNSPAIAASCFGKGHVVFISPHPEQTLGLEDLVRRAAEWAAVGH